MPVRSALFAVLGAALFLTGAACQPSLPSPPPDDERPSPDPEPRVTVEPDGTLDSAPRVLRLRISPPPGAVADVSRLLFVRGHVGEAHVRQAAGGDVSAALSERALPAIAWSEEGALVLAPIEPLDPDTVYGVLSGEPPFGLDLRTSSDDPTPLFRRVWPPPGASGAGAFAVHCGESRALFAPTSIELDPLFAPATVRSGREAGLDPACLRVDLAPSPPAPSDDHAEQDLGQTAILTCPPVEAPGSEAPPGPPGTCPPAEGAVSASEASALALPPPLVVTSTGAPIRLDPSPIAIASAPTPDLAAPACAAGEIAFGPGCARVEDDRLFVTSPPIALFWSVRTGATGPLHRASAPSETWALTGLHPSQTAAFDVATIDLSGDSRAFTLAAVTSPPRPHVVISEVLADPLGAEPAQEWVEIYNDGLAPADLTGHALLDTGGETPLPPALLQPHEYALIVNDAFDPADDADPPPPPAALLLRVPKLGKSGLKNDGEPLKLASPAGEILSRFPASPKPKPGQSVARIDLSSPDQAASSFVRGTPTPCMPGAPSP